MHASFQRSRLSGLLQQGGVKAVTRTALLEFLSMGFEVCVPVGKGSLTRGVRTAYVVEPLESASRKRLHPVWSYVEGGRSGAPPSHCFTNMLYWHDRDPKLYELLSLVNALGNGRVCERKLPSTNHQADCRSWLITPSISRRRGGKLTSLLSIPSCVSSRPGDEQHELY